MVSFAVTAAVILRCAVLFAVYYLFRGTRLLLGGQTPARWSRLLSEKEGKLWCKTEGKICIFWSVLLFLAFGASFFARRIFAVAVLAAVFVLMLAGYVYRVKNNMRYLKNQKR